MIISSILENNVYGGMRDKWTYLSHANWIIIMKVCVYYVIDM